MENLEKQKEHRGLIVEPIENKTTKIPTDSYLVAAFVSMGASLTLKLIGKKNTALFIGQWAAPFLLLVIYNKLNKSIKNNNQP